MKILVINCGSSSIKYQLFDADKEQVMVKGQVSKIGESGSFLRQETDGVRLQKDIPIADHHIGFNLIVESLLDEKEGTIKDISEVAAVGHRAGHGGVTFNSSVIINEDVIARMEEAIPIAPLHNPANLMGIRESRRIFPGVTHVAVFDSAFHQTMPPDAYIYGLPYECYEKHKIRRYGFHGTSCRYICQRVPLILKQSLEGKKLVICHLGSGASVHAVKDGKSVDSSLGFATTAGVIMGTRPGDIDTGLIFYMHRHLGLSLDRIEEMMHRESGILGVSGISNDMHEVIENAKRGNKRCQLAIEVFVHQVKKYIGAFAAIMEGIDTLVFTAGIGENAPLIREMICEGLEFLGIKLDEAVNNKTLGVEQVISTADAGVKVLVVPTDEERMIALDTIALALPLVKKSQVLKDS